MFFDSWGLPLSLPGPQENRYSLLGNFTLFVRPDCQDFDGSAVSVDFQDFFVGRLVFPVVHRDSEGLEPLAALLPKRACSR